jgi:universal stress protein E
MTNSNKFRHLLVILNKDLNSDIALDRAITFAEKHDAKITIFKSFYKMLNKVNSGQSNAIPDDLSIFVRDQQRLISKQYNLLTDQDLTLNIVISWQDPASIAISHLLKDSKVDLIFKSPKTKRHIKELFSTGLDHFLIRDCNTPVWMVKPRFWDEKIEVLTCLDVDDESDSNSDLNYHILETGESIAALYDAELHIVDCYFGERVSMSFDYNQKTGFETKKVSKHITKINSKNI